MHTIEADVLILGFSALIGLFIGLQLFLSLYTLYSLKSAAKERGQLNKEMFGLLKRIEALSAHKRELVLKHYDQILDTLSKSLPATIAAHTSQAIIDTESKVLTRLAELEPNLNKDEASKKKMDDLIKSMQHLEHSLVVLTSDTVRRVMTDSRKSLLEEANFLGNDEFLAA